MPRIVSHHTTLVIANSMNEDEFVLTVEDKEWDLDDSRVFSIAENRDGIPAFCWLNEGEDSFVIFVLDDASRGNEVAHLVGYFLWRHRYGENPEQKEMDELKALIGKKSFPFDLETLEFHEQSQPTSKQKEQKKKSSGIYPEFEPQTQDAEARYDNEKKLNTYRGNVFLLDEKKNQFEQRGDEFDLNVIELKKYVTMLVISQPDGTRVLSAPLNSMLNLQVLGENNAVSFNTSTKDLFTWAFMFNPDEAVDAQKLLVECVWESQYQKSFSTLDPHDQHYIYASYASGEIEEYHEGYDSDDFVDLGSDEEDEEDDEPVRRGRAPSSSNTEKNSLLVDSAKHDRAFVVRGNQIGVFNDDNAQYEGMINVKGKPEQIMLHNNESRMLMSRKGKVEALDLTKEKIVEEYEGDGAIQKIGNVQKYAEQTHQPLFAAMNERSIWGMDPRLPGKSQVIQKQDYKQNPKFSVFGTTSEGQLAVGSEEGIIRLYSGIHGLQKMNGKGTNPFRAKTNLPGLGDAITGIDVSGDGKWVLATCKYYLMAIPTEYENSTGFAKRMGKDKPTPLRLYLHSDDVRQLGGEINFTPAKFNTGADGETWLVTSTGNYLITWNFRRVQKGYLHDYNIKRMHDQVSTEQFVALEKDAHGGNDAPIFVVLDNDVAIEKRVRRRSNPFRESPRF